MRLPMMLATGILGGEDAYWQWLRRLFGTSLIADWELLNNANDYSGNGRHGAATDVVFDANGALFNGVSSFVNVYSASLSAAWNPAAFGIIVELEIPDIAVWSDTTVRDLVMLYKDANNRAFIQRSATNRQIVCFFIAGATNKSVSITNRATSAAISGKGFKETGKLVLIFTGSVADNELVAFVDGVQWSVPATGLGTWLGTLGANNTVIGAVNVTPTGTEWAGYAKHVAITNRRITTTEAKQISKKLCPKKIISIFGDSISNDATDWPYLFSDLYNGGKNFVIDHAFTGNGIVVGDNNFAWQVSQAENDDADEIIILLGTNDNNAGDMAALKAAYAAGIIALRASNPRARINFIQVLPRYDVAAEKGNIRTAIVEECASQNVPLHSITTLKAAEDYAADNIHPTAATGMPKIAAEILTWF